MDRAIFLSVELFSFVLFRLSIFHMKTLVKVQLISYHHKEFASPCEVYELFKLRQYQNDIPFKCSNQSCYC